MDRQLLDPLCGSGTLLIEAASLAASHAQTPGQTCALGQLTRTGDFRDLQPPDGPGTVVCNPPYGERLGGDQDLEALYNDLGVMVKQQCSGWDFWLLSGNPRITGALRMKASRRIPINNGGIDCRWLHYQVR